MAELQRGQKVTMTGLSADDVVDDLVPGHDLEGVGAGVVADLEGDHGLPVGEPVWVVGHGCELGVVDGRDAVSDLAEEDFRVVDGVLGEVGAPGVPAGGVGLSEVGGRVEVGGGDGRGRCRGLGGEGGLDVGLRPRLVGGLGGAGGGSGITRTLFLDGRRGWGRGRCGASAGGDEEERYEEGGYGEEEFGRWHGVVRLCRGTPPHSVLETLRLRSGRTE